MTEPGYMALRERLNSKMIPDDVKDLIQEMHMKIRACIGQATGAIELAYGRGVMVGSEEQEMEQEMDRLRAEIASLEQTRTQFDPDRINQVMNKQRQELIVENIKLRAEVARKDEALNIYDKAVEKFLDNITARDFLHLRGPSDNDMAWLRGFIKHCSLSDEMKQARAALGKSCFCGHLDSEHDEHGCLHVRCKDVCPKTIAARGPVKDGR